MGTLWRWLRRALGLLAALLAMLLVPVLWVEISCRPDGEAAAYEPLLPPEHRRDEARTLMTWPEWHIVHAYDDYAQVIAAGDPHEFGFSRAVRGFWEGTCEMYRASGAHGPVGWDTKQMVYVIGASFTAEMGLKALYEETLGRLFAWARGPARSEADAISAAQAADYAAFLTQTPWYLYDFEADIAELGAARGGLRDTERRLALGAEYRAKSLYAGLIEEAVGTVGGDALTMRSVVSGVPMAELRGLPGVTVIGDLEGGEGAVIETPRYRAFTSIVRELAGTGGRIEEIAGNDEVMITVIGEAPAPGALMAMQRQGHGDWRSLIVLPVAELLETVRAPAGARLEHVHDY